MLHWENWSGGVELKVFKIWFVKIFVKLINNSRRKHKRNHEREGVCISDTGIMLIYINFKFNFLSKYHSYTNERFHSHPCCIEPKTRVCISDTTWPLML